MDILEVMAPGADEAPRARQGVERIPAYIPGEAPPGGTGRSVKLSSNESPLGCSPLAAAAFQAHAGALQLYPDAGAQALHEAIAGKFGLDPARVVTACGSEELLHLAARAFVDTGDEVVVSQYGFIGHHIAGLAAGGERIVVPERDYSVDLDAMAAAVGPRTKLVFIANPGNPTGTVLPAQAIADFHAGLPRRVVLVLDAAYAEFAELDPAYRCGLDLAETSDNVLVTRTFSKMYGLAGLRIGWGYGQASLIENINRVRPAFNANAVAQAVAIVALEDDDFVRRSRDLNSAGLVQLSEGLAKLGIAVTPSVCNFVLAHFGTETPGADALFEALRQRGVVVRPVKGYGLPDALRISVGLPEDNQFLLDELAVILAGAR